MRISLNTTSTSTPTPVEPTYEPVPIDPAWKTVAKLGDAQLNEVSGVAVSQARDGVMWVHNDSGDSARVFAIDGAGALVQTVRVEGAIAFDWEDIAMGPGRGGAGSALYVADTGDNFLIRPYATIYRFPEPAAGATSAVAEPINVRFPDGRARDVEAVTVDPRSGDVLLISKQRRADAAEVFRLPRAATDAGGGTLEFTGTIPGVDRLVTGADISADGSRIAVTTYDRTYGWKRALGESVVDVLHRRPDVTQTGTGAESVGFTRDGASWVSIPEGEHAPIYRRATTMQG